MTRIRTRARWDPVLVLGVTGAPGTSATPLFAAVHVTADLVDRMRHLYVLCRTYQLDGIRTRSVAPPVYWDVASHSAGVELSEATTHWHVDTQEIHVRLWGRLRMENGNLGPPALVARSRAFDIFDLQHWRDEGYLVALHPLEPVDQGSGAAFASHVYRRMVELGLWPKLEPRPQGWRFP
jgi:hypothetical protein